MRLLVSATRVQDGAVRAFRTKAITREVVLASACLPRLHRAVDIHGEAHWDGGYAANPPLVPLVGASHTSDLLLVDLVPDGPRRIAGHQVGDPQAVGRDHVQQPAQKELETIGLMKTLVRKEGESARGLAARSRACGCITCPRRTTSMV